jgi:hypothetical protein
MISPTTIWTRISAGTAQSNSSTDVRRLRVSSVVKITASGSLRPDSTSSVVPTRHLRLMPLPRRTEKIAAASVDDTTAPRRSASGIGRPAK